MSTPAKHDVKTKRKAVAEWQAGTPFRDVMKKYNIASTGALSAWRKQLARIDNSDGKNRTGNKSRFSDAQKAEAVRRLNAGETAKTISDELGVSEAAVFYWRQHGASSKLEKRKDPVMRRDDVMRDVLIYLRHAKIDVDRRLRAGELKEEDEAHLLLKLALKKLEAR